MSSSGEGETEGEVAGEAQGVSEKKKDVIGMGIRERHFRRLKFSRHKTQESASECLETGSAFIPQPKHASNDTFRPKKAVEYAQ